MAWDSNGDGISDGQDVTAGRDPVVDKRARMQVVAPAEDSTVSGNDVRLVAERIAGMASDIVSVVFEIRRIRAARGVRLARRHRVRMSCPWTR